MKLFCKFGRNSLGFRSQNFIKKHLAMVSNVPKTPSNVIIFGCLMKTDLNSKKYGRLEPGHDIPQMKELGGGGSWKIKNF